MSEPKEAIAISAETAAYLLKELKKGDCVLFKASLGMDFARLLSLIYAGLDEN